MVTARSIPRSSAGAVVSDRGAIACGHQVAAEIGAAVLERGGNAVDATIAAAFASFVVEPASCGIGGHGRFSIHMAGRGVTVGIDHFIRAPAAATPARVQAALAQWAVGGHLRPGTAISPSGHLAVGIPGAIAGLCEAHRLFGSRKLAELVAPAIDLAEAGLPVDWRLALRINERAAEIRTLPGLADLLLRDGLPPRPATWTAEHDRLDFTALAETLKAIAAEGSAAFYRGRIAAVIDADMRAHGGLLTADDLGAYRPEVYEQRPVGYRSFGVVTCGDLFGTETLNILEHFDVPRLDPDGPAWRHLMAEVLGQAFVDNLAHAGDPRHLRVPLDGIASKAYAALAAARIQPGRAQSLTPIDPWPFQPGDGALPPLPFAGTTQICAGDASGNMVTLITSIGSSFGSLVLVPGTGIILGNAMQWFDPRPGLLNSVGPGRMPLYVSPVLLAFRDGAPAAAIGASGGYRIPTAVLHVFVNLADFGMEVADAVEHPRLHCGGEGIEADAAIPAGVIAALRGMGHEVRMVDGDGMVGGFGRPSAVWRDARLRWHAASDPHAGGAAGV